MHDKEDLEKELKTTKENNKSRPTVNAEALKVSAVNEELFAKALDRLCYRWWDRPRAISDTTGGMLVTSTLASHINEPVVIAMIADDVNAFKKHYSEKNGDIFCFEFCCLCGSENIIKEIYLADPTKKECLRLSNNAIGYILSSGKVEIALSLANEAIKMGKIDPGQVMLYSFGKFESAISITNMFSTIDPTKADLNDTHTSTPAADKSNYKQKF